MKERLIKMKAHSLEVRNKLRRWINFVKLSINNIFILISNLYLFQNNFLNYVTIIIINILHIKYMLNL